MDNEIKTIQRLVRLPPEIVEEIVSYLDIRVSRQRLKLKNFIYSSFFFSCNFFYSALGAFIGNFSVSDNVIISCCGSFLLLYFRSFYNTNCQYTKLKDIRHDLTLLIYHIMLLFLSDSSSVIIVSLIGYPVYTQVVTCDEISIINSINANFCGMSLCFYLKLLIQIVYEEYIDKYIESSLDLFFQIDNVSCVFTKKDTKLYSVSLEVFDDKEGLGNFNRVLI
jgi:hypothetical protein